MKKITLLKAFWAVFLIFGVVHTPVSGQTRVYDLQEDFTSDVASWGFASNNGSTQTITYNTTNKLLQVRWPNGGSSYVKTLSTVITPGNDNTLKVELIIKGYTSGSSSNYGAFYLLDENGNAITGFHVRRGSIGGSNKWFVGRVTSYPGIATYSYPTSADGLNADQPTAKITFDLDFTAHTLSYAAEQGTFDYTSRVFTASGSTVSSSAQAFINASASNIKSFNSWYYRGATASGTNGFDMMYAGISALRTVATASVTVKYKDQDNNYFKADEIIGDQVVGNAFNASAGQKSTYSSGDFYYVLDPASALNTVVASEGSTLELLFRKQAKVSTLTWNGTSESNGNLWSEWNLNFTNNATAYGHQNNSSILFDGNASNKNVVLNEVVSLGASNITVSAPDYSITGTGTISGSGAYIINLGATDSVKLGVSNNSTGEAQISGGIISVNKSGALGAFANITGASTILSGATGVAVPSTTFGVSAQLNAGTYANTLINGMTAGNGVKVSILSAVNHASNDGSRAYDFAPNGTLAVGSELELIGAGTDNRIGMTSNSSTYLANTKVSLKGNTMFYINVNHGAASTINIGTLSGESTTKLGWGRSAGLERDITWSVGALNENSEFAGTITNLGGYASGGSSYTGNNTNFIKTGTGTLTMSGNATTHNGTVAVTGKGKLNVTGALGKSTTAFTVSDTSVLAASGDGKITAKTLVMGATDTLIISPSAKVVVYDSITTKITNVVFEITTDTAGVLVLPKGLSYADTINLTVRVLQTPVALMKTYKLVDDSLKHLVKYGQISLPSHHYTFNQSTGELVFEITTDVENAAQGLAVYPTFVRNEMTVNGTGIQAISLISLSGQIMMDVKNTSDYNKVNLSQLSDGAYLVKVGFTDGTTQIRNVILNK